MNSHSFRRCRKVNASMLFHSVHAVDAESSVHPACTGSSPPPPKHKSICAHQVAQLRAVPVVHVKYGKAATPHDAAVTPHDDANVRWRAATHSCALSDLHRAARARFVCSIAGRDFSARLATNQHSFLSLACACCAPPCLVPLTQMPPKSTRCEPGHGSDAKVQPLRVTGD